MVHSINEEEFSSDLSTEAPETFTPRHGSIIKWFLLLFTSVLLIATFPWIGIPFAVVATIIGVMISTIVDIQIGILLGFLITYGIFVAIILLIDKRFNDWRQQIRDES